MGSLEQVGSGVPPYHAPGAGSMQSGSEMSDEDTDFEAFEDDDEDYERPTNVRRAPSRMPIQRDDEEESGGNRGLHIGVHDGVSIHMRVTKNGEAEFNYGGRIWSKSPPSSLSKSKIKAVLESLRSLGVDTSAYEQSLGSVENYSAPLSMLAEDDIQHSYTILKTLHEEKESSRKRRTRKQEPPGPIFLSDPDYENRNRGKE